MVSAVTGKPMEPPLADGTPRGPKGTLSVERVVRRKRPFREPARLAQAEVTRA